MYKEIFQKILIGLFRQETAVFYLKKIKKTQFVKINFMKKTLYYL